MLYRKLEKVHFQPEDGNEAQPLLYFDTGQPIA